MRKRMISAAVVLGLGFAGITLAKQAGGREKSSPTGLTLPSGKYLNDDVRYVPEPPQIDGQPRQKAADKAQLRSQVAKLRAEVELLQLEHEVDVDCLRKLTTDMRNMDGVEAAKGPFKEQAKAIMKKMTAPAANFAQPALSEHAGSDAVENMFSVDEAVATALRPLLDRMRKEFVQKTAELNEKRMELAEAEKRYNESR